MGPALEEIGSSLGLFELCLHRGQMFVCLFEGSLPVFDHGALDDLAAESTKAPTWIGGGIDRTCQAQTVQMKPGEEPVSGATPLGRWDQAPALIQAYRIRMNADRAGKVGSVEIFGRHFSAKVYHTRWLRKRFPVHLQNYDMTIKAQHMAGETGLSILILSVVLFKSKDPVWDGRIKIVVQRNAAESWQLAYVCPPGAKLYA